MDNKTCFLSKFTSMEDLQINNWIILDPLGNIYVIYANLTMITLLNPLMITHFWRTQAEVCLKGTLVKASFMFVPILLDFHENRRRKSIVNPSCPKHSLIVNGDKKWHKFLFLSSLWCLKKVLSFWGSKKNCEKKIYHSPYLFGIRTAKVKTVFLSNYRLMSILFP